MDRRALLKAAGLGALMVSVGGVPMLLTPRQARAQAAALSTLTTAEARSLEALGEALLPGAAAAGIAHFVDHHLSVDPTQSLLMIRYMDMPPPYAPFYRGGLAALERLANARYGKTFADLDAAQAAELIRAISARQPEGWDDGPDSPPAPLFYFVVRSDAVDVVYGTAEGFEKLGIPYMAHIEPDSQW